MRKRIVVLGDMRLTVPEAAIQLGISVKALQSRLQRGWTDAQLSAGDCRAAQSISAFQRAPIRSDACLREIMERFNSPVRAALACELTAEEYLHLDSNGHTREQEAA